MALLLFVSQFIILSVCPKKNLVIRRSKASSFCSKALEEVLTVSTRADLVTSWLGSAVAPTVGLQ